MPRFPHKVTIVNPGSTATSALTGNEVPGDTVETVTRAYLSQRSVSDVGSALERNAGQTTTLALFTLLVPPGVPLMATSRVRDDQGRLYEVAGAPAARSNPLNRRTEYQAAALRLVSDLQPGTS